VTNAQHTGRQAEGVRKADIKPAGGGHEEAETHSHGDTISLSESANKGREAGVTTGMAGRQGAKETGAAEHTEDTHIGEDNRGRETGEAKPKAKPAEANAQVIQGEPVMPGEASGIAEQPMYIMGGPGAAPSEAGAPQVGAQAVPPGGAQPAGGQTPPPGGQTPPPGAEGPSNSYTDAAMKAKEAQEDAQKAQGIYAEMAASRQKWLMQMWQIIQDTQTTIMQMMQEAAIRRAKTMDAIAAKWAACLGGY
jgi:hypothetical protein